MPPVILGERYIDFMINSKTGLYEWTTYGLLWIPQAISGLN